MITHSLDDALSRADVMRSQQAKRVLDIDGEGEALVIDFNVVLR